MNTYEKKACAECGQMVSTMPMHWKKHENMHQREKERAAAEHAAAIAPVPPIAPTPAPAPAAEPAKASVATVDDIINDPNLNNELRADIRRARVAQAGQRKMAPDVTASPDGGSDPLRQWEAICKSEGLLGPNDHTFWGDTRLYKQDVASGYEPVVRGGEKVVYGGNTLLKIDKHITDAKIKSAEATARARMRTELQKGTDKSADVMKAEALLTT